MCGPRLLATGGPPLTAALRLAAQNRVHLVAFEPRHRFRDGNLAQFLHQPLENAAADLVADLVVFAQEHMQEVGAGDDADNSKPAPDIFAASLEKLGDISAADAVTVGDTRCDIEAAKKVGVNTIAFLCGGTPESLLRQTGAIAIYCDPADFLGHYDELVTHVSPP